MKRSGVTGKPRTAAKPPVNIVTDDDIRAGVVALRRKCRHFRHMHDRAGDPPLRRRPAGFEGLARIIVGQQVSVAAAAAIWTRFEASVRPMTPARVLALDDETLRGAGLSRPKVRTLRALSAAIAGGLDLENLDGHTDMEVHAALTAVSGIGPWTADVFIMFCLGRADAFAPGDLALQEAARMAMALDARPGKEEIAEIALRWRPYRGVAARMLWAYYAVAKAQKTAVPV